MKLVQRFGYYLGGFSIGIVILAFIWKGKKADFSYFPEARLLKNIGTKQLVYSQNVLELLKNKSIDSLTISEILKYGDVDFSKVDRGIEFCKLYVIVHEINEKDIALTVENCETIATVKSVSFE